MQRTGFGAQGAQENPFGVGDGVFGTAACKNLRRKAVGTAAKLNVRQRRFVQPDKLPVLLDDLSDSRSVG